MKSLSRCARVLAPIVISILVGILRAGFHGYNDGGEKCCLISEEEGKVEVAVR